MNRSSACMLLSQEGVVLLKRFWSLFNLSLFVFVCFLDSGFAVSSFDQSLAEQRLRLEDSGFIKWEWQQSQCDNCELVLLPTQEILQTEKVHSFIHALGVHKAELQSLYRIHGAEYTFLAHMSVGILGRETLFFTSSRYRLKEVLPWAVHLAKILEIYLEGSNRHPTPNSRGPTQIKVVPALVAKKYGITPDNLYRPENAAIATMGFLIEALKELKRRIAVNELFFINPANYVDYLPYIYFGRTKALLNQSARPATNSYVQDMKRYMSWVEVYERGSGFDLNHLSLQ